MSMAIALPPQTQSRRDKRNAAHGVTLERTLAGSDSRTSQVVRQLTALILDGELKRDALLPSERELALRLGVSRTVVREATKFLHSDGLVTIRHGAGTVINGASSEPVQRAMTQALHGDTETLAKLYEVRCTLETEIVVLAAQRALPHDIEKLRALCAAMDEYEDGENPERFWELDMAFHNTLAEATQNGIYKVVLEAATALLIPARRNSNWGGRTNDITQREHWGMAEAVEAGNSALAVEIMRKHLRAPDNEVAPVAKKAE